MSKLTAERLKEVALYDRDSGLFCSPINRGPIKTGDALGCMNLSGYIQIQIDGVIYYGHRLAWLFETGMWPSQAIDHIDGNRSNNSIKNLREAVGSINQQNFKRARKDSTSGFLGVSRHKEGKWTARIKTAQSYKHLGLFSTPELASQAYINAKRIFHEGNTL